MRLLFTPESENFGLLRVMALALDAPRLVQTLSRRPFEHITRSSTSVIVAATRKDDIRRLHITYTSDIHSTNVDDLAQLMSVCIPDRQLERWPSWTTNPCHPTDDDDADTTSINESFKDKLGRALRRSLVCVSAFAPERVVSKYYPCTYPAHAQWTPLSAMEAGQPLPPLSRWREKAADVLFPAYGPKVLVGFARAVGDASLVATIHDVMVLPCLRDLGIGTALVDLLTRKVQTRSRTYMHIQGHLRYSNIQFSFYLRS